MKKIRILLSIMLVMMITAANAQSIIIQPVEVTVGGETELSVRVSNCTNMTSLQFNLHLPEGLNYTTQGGNYGATLSSAANGHAVNVETLDNGDPFIIVYSRNFTKFKSGELLRIPVTAGNQPMSAEGQVYTFRCATADAASYQGNSTTFTVTVNEEQAPETPVTITANDLTMVYGDDVPKLTYTAQGEVLGGAPELTTTATKTSPAGTYPITVKAGTLTNSSVTCVNGTLTITKAPLTVKADDATMKQGDPVPNLTLSYEGFRNGDTETTAFTTKPSAKTTATSSSSVGTYAITVSGGSAKNYNLTYQNGTLTVEPSGSDASNLLVNPLFNDGFTGWTNSNGGQVVGNVGGKDFFPVVECYESVVDVQQTVKASPGVYAISVYAFERPGHNTQFTGDENLKVRLFMNQFSTPVQHIVKDALPTEQCIENENSYRGSGSGNWPYDYHVNAFGWIPNSVDGASYAFNSGRYLQSCYGLVGEDGVMTIGLTSDGVSLTLGGWCLWAGFKLTYMAKDMDAMSNVIDYYVDLTEKIEKAGSPDVKKYRDAISRAQKATNGETMYTELFNVADAYETVLESQKAYIDAIRTYSNLQTAVKEYAGSASKESLAAANAMLSDYKGINNYEFARADLPDMIVEMERTQSRVKMPDYSVAPCDFTNLIENNSFERGDLSGWQYNQGMDTGAKSVSDNTYVVYDADGQYLFNTWSPTPPSEGFWISQTLRCLPAGTYSLQVGVASDMGNIITLSANEFSTEIEANAKTWMTGGSLSFTLTEESDVVIKASSNTWFKADCFELKLIKVDATNIKGDVNEDKSVDISDIVAVINQIAGTTNYRYADVNGDKNVDISDIVSIINIIAVK